MICKIFKIVLAGFFLICLLDMPYGYYQLIRYLGMIIFFVLAYNTYKNDNTQFAILWFMSGVLINPIIKISLGRTIWNIIDVIWAILLFASLWIEKGKLRKKINDTQLLLDRKKTHQCITHAINNCHDCSKYKSCRSY